MIKEYDRPIELRHPARQYPEPVCRYQTRTLSCSRQEFEETIKEFEVKNRKKRERKSKPVQYWGIIPIFEGRKIKVILRKIGNGQMHFWSINLLGRPISTETPSS